MKKSIILTSILCFIAIGNALNFRKIVELPRAAEFETIGFDTDQDGKQNLVFTTNTTPFYIHFWEHIGFDRYILEDSCLPSSILYDVGYLDADSLVDMVGNRNGWPYPLYVYESPTQYSNPTNVVWQDSLLYSNICGGYITNLDEDGVKEMLFRYTDPYTLVWHTSVYECAGDNQYSLVWEDTTNPSAYFINGDFDLDGQIEFATGIAAAYGEVLVWECIGNDNYQLTFYDSLPWSNNYDIFSANDMDSNGKPEFLFTSVDYADHIVWLYLYETIRDNNYDFFLIDSITGIPGSMWRQRSECGDIDADGKDEIVWSTFSQWHIYKVTGIHPYQRIYSSAWTTNSATYITVYDLNENGYPEIIEAGRPDRILIWEIEGVRLHRPNGGEILNPGDTFAITWEKFDPPGADSFTLFISFDNGANYQTIATIQQSNDTSYLWTVPDSLSDSCKIMIWAYGPPRPGEQQPRGTAWDFSDNVFSISDEGIETDSRWQIADGGLQILQNPVIGGNLKIQYSIPKTSKVKLVIYNALGQVVRVLVDKEMATGIYEIELNEPLTRGVYFIKLIMGEKNITKKCIMLKD